MNIKYEIDIKEVLWVLLFPVVLAAAFSMNHVMIWTIYLLLMVSLLQFDIVSNTKKIDGYVVYRRSEPLCSFKCIMGRSFMITIVYMICVWFVIPVVVMALIIAIMGALFSRQLLQLSIYSNGIMHKGYFYDLKTLKSSYIVKNYKGLYEIYMGRKVMKLTKTEMNLMKIYT